MAAGGGVAQLMLHICAMYRDRTIACDRADGGRAGKHRQCIKSGANSVEEDELTALCLEDGREGQLLSPITNLRLSERVDVNVSDGGARGL